MLAGALYTYKKDCLQSMAIETTLIGDTHFEALGKHDVRVQRDKTDQLDEKSLMGMVRVGGGVCVWMDRFGKDYRLRSVTEEMLGSFRPLM